MTTFAAPAARVPARDFLIWGGGLSVLGLLLVAFARHGPPAAHGAQGMSPWLVIHLLTVIPALPLGAYVLAARKGDRRHRMLGRIWAALMIVTALSSFGVRSINDGLSTIHIFSVITLISIPRAIWFAKKGDVRRHRRGMTLTYVGLVTAGLFAFLPGRVLGMWLFG